MRYAALTAELPRVSVVAFGCASVGGRKTKAESLRALARASDLGVNLFDTARSYGFGESERILGGFLKGRRENALISSKAGIRSFKASPVLRVAKDVARKVFDLAPGLRKHAQAQLGKAYARDLFNPTDLRASVEESLRELQTDYLDILFLHAAPPEVIDRDEVFSLFDELKKAGKIRQAGVSGPIETLDKALAQRPGQFDVVQVAATLRDGDLFDRAKTPEWQRIGRIAIQPFGGGGAVPALEADLRRLLPTLPAATARKLTDNWSDAVTDLMINSLLADSLAPVVLTSMFDAAHIQCNVAVAGHSRFTPDELRALRLALGAVRLDLPAGVPS